MLIDLNMNPSPQDSFIVAQDRAFLKPRRSGKSGTSQIVSFEHAKASAALAASFKPASRKYWLGRFSQVTGLIRAVPAWITSGFDQPLTTIFLCRAPVLQQRIPP